MPGSGLQTSGGVVRSEQCLSVCCRDWMEVERKQEGSLAGSEFSGLLRGVTDPSHDPGVRKTIWM